MTETISTKAMLINFVTNGKHMYDFLLTNNSNYGPIFLQRFGDTAMYRLNLPTPVGFNAPLGAAMIRE